MRGWKSGLLIVLGARESRVQGEGARQIGTGLGKHSSYTQRRDSMSTQLAQIAKKAQCVYVLPHVTFLPFASSEFLPFGAYAVLSGGEAGRSSRLRLGSLRSAVVAEILCHSLHIANQPLHRLLPPNPEPPLHSTQMPKAVSTRVASLELRQELARGLVRARLQLLKHFRPIRRQRVRPATSARFRRGAVAQGADFDSAGASILAPLSHSLCEGTKLTPMPPARVLGA